MLLFRATLAALLMAVAACTAPGPTNPAPVLVGDAGSAAAGRAYAQDACAGCHAVLAGDEASPHPDAPPFAAIVETPGMSGLALTVWLRSEHEQMPHFIVDPARVDDLWAYMATLQQDDGGNQ